MSITLDTNDHMVLISGYSASGKSRSLKNIPDQQDWLYLNCEAGKALPFKNKFRVKRITDPLQVFTELDSALKDKTLKGVIIDSITFLMEMVESQYVLTSANTMKAWSDYHQYLKTLMQVKLALLNIPVVLIAHVQDIYDEKAMDTKTSVPLKGAAKQVGLEAYLNHVIYTDKVSLKDLEPYKSNLLTITDGDKALGFKYVFQTRLTKNTLNKRLRNPEDLFDTNETYIDNDISLVINRLNEYYS